MKKSSELTMEEFKKSYEGYTYDQLLQVIKLKDRLLEDQETLLSLKTDELYRNWKQPFDYE